MTEKDHQEPSSISRGSGRSSYSGELKRDLLSQLSKLVVITSISLATVAGIGFWWYLKSTVVSIVGGVPSNGIVAFDQDECPEEGWVEYSGLAGRVIVGQGRGESLTDRKYRETGGEEIHTLTEAELPPHDHDFEGNESSIGGIGGIKTRSFSYGDAQEHGQFQVSGDIKEAGEGKAHNNMPPFLVLTYCKKI